MRLVCPNCAAQYEVDDSVIPSAGRDVQCSNCGHVWFQPGAFHSAALEAPQDEEEPPEEFDAQDDEVMASVTDSVAEQAVGDAADAADATAPMSDGPEALAGALDMHAALRRNVDPSVLDVLREEGEREVSARRAEGTALEMQQDLGLPEVAVGAAMRAEESEPANPAGHEGDAMASVFPDAEPDAEDDVGPRGHRRGLLPDIEEINSTLSASSGRSHGGEPVVTAEVIRRRKSGFRMGFSMSLLVAAVLLALYLFAPAIAGRVPALQPPLERYVSGVNDVRLWIDEKMRSSTEALREKAPATN